MEYTEKFRAAVVLIINIEGGDKYTNDPDDPGGETKYGISKRAHPDLDIKNLTLEKAKEIYYNEYWSPAGCEQMPYHKALVHFDTAVNNGLSRAVTIDTNAIIFNDNTPDYLLKRICYYIALVRKKSKNKKYILGWINRIADIYDAIT